MLEDNKKIITVSFLVTAALVGFLAHVFMNFMAANVAIFERIRSQDIYSNGIPVALAAITFAVLQFNPRVVEFVDSVVMELKKVVWPPPRDTMIMTVVVVITLIISGVLVGLYDALWAYLINMIVK